MQSVVMIWNLTVMTFCLGWIHDHVVTPKQCTRLGESFTKYRYKVRSRSLQVMDLQEHS